VTLLLSKPAGAVVATAAATPTTNQPAIASEKTKAPAVATPTSSPSPLPAKGEVTALNRKDIVGFLGHSIGWYRSVASEASRIDEPDETLFATDNRRLANEALKYAFAFARAAAPIVEDNASKKTPRRAPASPSEKDVADDAVRTDLQDRRRQVQNALTNLQVELQKAQSRLATATRRQRDQLTREIVGLQAQKELADSRLASIEAMIDFANDTAATRNSGTDIEAQIDELEHALPNLNATDHLQPEPLATPTAASPDLPSGLEHLLNVRAKRQALDSEIESTNSLSRAAVELRQKLLTMLAELDHQGLQQQTTRATEIDATTAKEIKAKFDALEARNKLLANATLPLSKQIVVLDLYSTSLQRWRDNIGAQFRVAFRRILVHLAGLAILLAVLLIAASLWRRLTFRYIQEPQRRYQLLQLRRVVMIVIVGLVIIFSFANDLGNLATIMGFAAAGVALALQNVITSIVGYFYLSGRFGVRLGDRVQMFGIEGDVLDSTFLKITLMELTGDPDRRQPSGRAVSFPNSMVFQPNCNFFRQMPGTSFTWNELRLNLSAAGDYRLAEKRIIEIVSDVFAHYRDTILRESRAMEDHLNIHIEPPRPHTHLQFSSAGFELIVRYPVRLSTAPQTKDEITRRLIDAIARDPALAMLSPKLGVTPPSPGPTS